MPSRNNVPAMDGYVRVSRVQGREGESYISPKIQEEAIRKWASYKGVEIAMVHVDEDWSGGTHDRPGLNLAIQRALDGETRGIVAWKIDRFSRNSEQGIRDLRRLKEANARLAFCVEDIDTETIYGRMMYQILLSVSEAFLENIKVSWIDAKATAIGRGAQVGALPYGYRQRDNGTLEPDERAPLVTEAFKRAAMDGIGAAQTYLIEHDDSRTWTTTQVRRILSNKVYLGKVSWHDKANDRVLYAADDHTHTALTEPRIWEAAQDQPAKRQAAAEFPLSGLLTCGSCGAHMVGGRGGLEKKRMYRCSAGLALAKFRCSAPPVITADIIEPFVMDTAKKLVKDLRVTIGDESDLADLELAIILAKEELHAFVSDLTMRRALGDSYHEQLELRVQAVADAEQAYRQACRQSAQERSYTPEDLERDPETLRDFLSALYVVKVKRGKGLKVADRVDFLRLASFDADGVAAIPST